MTSENERKLSFESEASEKENLLNSSLTYLTFAYRENLFGQLDRLVETGKSLDGLIIDLMQTGYSIPIDVLAKFSLYAKKLLKPQGVLLFVKGDGAITLTRDDPGGGLTFNIYDSPFGIFTRYPLLADYACATIAGIDRRRLRGGGNTLANHILSTSVPVMSDYGKSVKNDFTLPAPQNWVMQFVDDYASVESITRNVENRHQLPPDEALRILQEFEAAGLIYPVFSRIQFLSNCYHNRKPFRLGRYLVASGILNEAQLHELLEKQQEEGWGKSQRSFLGLLAVRAGFINTRELEVLLDDQYLYGGYHKRSEDDQTGPRPVNIETMRDSMIGSLGAIDSAGLLQSLSTAKKTGLLTVDNRDKTLIVAFDQGRPSHALLNKLHGYNAMVEFITTWHEGIFVFRDKGESTELLEKSRFNHSLDRLLLDSALFQDQMAQILKTFPQGQDSILERVWNFEALWLQMHSQPLKYMDESPVMIDDRKKIAELAGFIDGLSTLDEVIKSYSGWPTHMIVKGIYLLLQLKLATIQQGSLFRPLTIFQNITEEIQFMLGPDDNKAILISSLHYVHGDSLAKNRFHIDHEGRISVNLSQMKRAGIPVSAVLLELRRWMEAYLAYCRRQIDSKVVDEIVARVISTHTN
ncbi:MAG: DUF4388 domain-containing protein [Candidatus Obscuribacter sp.]|nr:DUF4388 domain-containing protein [Candidatus Obscuribacter sp.]MBK9618426.1 DUF4388 domain-containing protein [Candidatus Obscuribacter sp.]MBK9772293.1 DUF4388 domain-containing protein [Candidatus Obscuribacter sp.]